jgi:haemagglutination activity domain
MSTSPQTHPRWARHVRTLLLTGLLLVSTGLMASQAAVTSAITGDGTPGTTVTRSGTLYTITGGTRPGNGPNLFHSFDRFSIGTGDTARFGRPTGIADILSRVTGGEAVLDRRAAAVDHSGDESVSAQSERGEVVFSPLEVAPDLQVDSFTRLGRVALSQGVFLDASGNGGGTVLRRGRGACESTVRGCLQITPDRWMAGALG